MSILVEQCNENLARDMQSYSKLYSFAHIVDLVLGKWGLSIAKPSHEIHQLSLYEANRLVFNIKWSSIYIDMCN